jgi:hypothetical protein
MSGKILHEVFMSDLSWITDTKTQTQWVADSQTQGRTNADEHGRRCFLCTLASFFLLEKQKNAHFH